MYLVVREDEFKWPIKRDGALKGVRKVQLCEKSIYVYEGNAPMDDG